MKRIRSHSHQKSTAILCAVGLRSLSRSYQDLINAEGNRTPKLLTAWKDHNLPERLSLIKFRFTLIGISLYAYSLAVQLPPLNGQYVRKGRSTLQPGVNNSLTLNSNLCRKRQLNLGRTSLAKRKALHRKKRIQRKKHGKVKDADSPVHRAGLLLCHCLNFGLGLQNPQYLYP